MADSKTLCVYDPGGASGDAYQIIKDYRTAAAGWGVNFTLKPYTDEKTAAEDFKAGQCQAVAVDYRLAPAHAHPAAVEDSVKVYAWLLDNGYAPNKIAIAGDSAGGGGQNARR